MKRNYLLALFVLPAFIYTQPTETQNFAFLQNIQNQVVTFTNTLTKQLPTVSPTIFGRYAPGINFSPTYNYTTLAGTTLLTAALTGAILRYYFLKKSTIPKPDTKKTMSEPPEVKTSVLEPYLKTKVPDTEPISPETITSDIKTSTHKPIVKISQEATSKTIQSTPEITSSETEKFVPQPITEINQEDAIENLTLLYLNLPLAIVEHNYQAIPSIIEKAKQVRSQLSLPGCIDLLQKNIFNTINAPAKQNPLENPTAYEEAFMNINQKIQLVNSLIYTYFNDKPLYNYMINFYIQYIVSKKDKNNYTTRCTNIDDSTDKPKSQLQNPGLIKQLVQALRLIRRQQFERLAQAKDQITEKLAQADYINNGTRDEIQLFFMEYPTTKNAFYSLASVITCYYGTENVPEKLEELNTKTEKFLEELHKKERDKKSV